VFYKACLDPYELIVPASLVKNTTIAESVKRPKQVRRDKNGYAGGELKIFLTESVKIDDPLLG
jgi:hypothetical protein